MKSIEYSIVDVFAQRKYTGNQLAVFKDAGSLSDKEMQQMAKEINFSETTFITSSSAKGEYNV
jgi:trans-2,3-dihydro-3-hydroxyanthranilate isomerase